MYESLDSVDPALLDEAIQVKGALQASGVHIQLRTFQSLISTANKAGVYDVAESLYLEATATVGPDSSPLVDVETEYMHTLNLQRLFGRSVGIYDKLVKNGGEPNEFTVAHAVDASVAVGRFETAIRILNKWHDQGGVTTWNVSHSILQLAIAIENFVQNKKSPLFAPENVHQDGVVYNRAKLFPTRFVPKKFSPNSPMATKADLIDNSYDHAKEGEALTVNVEELPQQGEEADAVDVTAKIDVAVSVDVDVKSKTTRPTKAVRPQFATREERLTFFKEYLVRRVLVRIDQGFDMGLRRHRRECVVPEDVLALACGHMAMRGSLDRLFDKLQGGALDTDKSEELLPVVQRIFVCAPIQMLRYKGHWRELAGLVERMEAYRAQIPNEVFAAAVSRSVSALFDNRQETRALWQVNRYLDSLLATDKTEELFVRVLHDADTLCLPDVMTALHKSGRSVGDTYLLHSVRVIRTKHELFSSCKAFVGVSGGEIKPLSNAVCDEIVSVVKSRLKLNRKFVTEDELIGQLTALFRITPEQSDRIKSAFLTKIVVDSGPVDEVTPTDVVL
eukprot:gene22700-28851_t